MASDETMATSLEWVIFSFGHGLGNDLHVTAQTGRVRVGLGQLAVEPDRVVPGEFGKPTSDYTTGERGMSK